MFSGWCHCSGHSLQRCLKSPALVRVRGSLLYLRKGSLGIFFHGFRYIGHREQLLNLLDEPMHTI